MCKLISADPHELRLARFSQGKYMHETVMDSLKARFSIVQKWFQSAIHAGVTKFCVSDEIVN
jgi:hypothetical protein